MHPGEPNRPTIAVPVGDPSGIGPEIAIMAATDPGVLACARLLLVSDPSVVETVASRLGLSRDLDLALADGRAAIHPVDALTAPVEPGRIDAAAGAATVAYATEAIRLAQRGEVAAVVAAPHNETAVASAGIAFSGYPSLLAEVTGTQADKVFLMLVSPRFRIVHATLHVGLRDALASLSQTLVLNALTAAHNSLRQLGFDRPKIGVCGINPHAGEHGLFGDEDETITRPAVEAARHMGIDAGEPAGADVLLGAGAHDAYIAMYHDQGHVPAKLDGRGKVLGISIGTPVLFSTVAHGSAHDIAGTGRADPAALAGAIMRMADILGRQDKPAGEAAQSHADSL